MKHLAIIFLLFTSILGYGQTYFEKGKKIKNFALSTDKSLNNSNVNFDFEYLKIIQQNLAVGLNFGLSTGWSDILFVEDNLDFKFLPTIRYMIPQTEKSLYFAEFGVGKVYSDTYDFEKLGNQTELKLGYAYFLNKSIALEPNVFIKKSKFKDNGDNGYSEWSDKVSSVNYGLNIRLNLYLDKLKLPNFMK
jgi:hypothetical protein